MSEETETQNSQEPETNEEVQTEDTQEETNESLVGKGEEEEAPPAEEFVPLTADDITFSEDLTVPDNIRDEFLELVNNQEMSVKDRAQALVNLQEKAAQQASEANSQAWTDQQKAWQDEVKADGELGGGNFQKTLSNVNRLVEQYGSEELIGVMGLTGAGNNIHVIRFLNKVAGVALEGSPTTGGPTNAESDRASRMFPSMKG